MIGGFYYVFEDSTGKLQGFSRNTVSCHLKLSWATVNRYWNMPMEEENNRDSYQLSAMFIREAIFC